MTPQTENDRFPPSSATAPIMLHVEPRRPKRRKWIWRLMWALLAVVAGAWGFWWWSDRQALEAREALIAAARARGEPVFWDEVAEKLLRERDGGTGAELYLQALWALGGELNPGGPKVVSAKWELAHSAERTVPAIRPELQEELKLGKPALVLLEKAVVRPPGLLTSALKTEDPISILLPHVQDGRNLARYLHWFANDALARGDVKGAYHAVWLCLGTSQQLAVEPFLIAQAVRFAIRGEAYSALKMCVEYAPPPEDEFRAIDRALAAVDDTFGIERCWHAERAMWMTILDNPAKLREGLTNMGFRGGGNDFEAFLRRRWTDIMLSPLGRPAIRRTQASLLRLSERIGPLLDRPNIDPARRNAAFDDFEREASFQQSAIDVGDWGLRGINSFVQTCEKAHRRCIMARLMLRLRRHFDKHGKFPEKLEELCDAEMPKIRLDWFREQAIIYEATKTGFRLEVPESLLTQDEKRRKREQPDSPPDFVVKVELKKLGSAPAGKKE